MSILSLSRPVQRVKYSQSHTSQWTDVSKTANMATDADLLRT